MHCHKQVKTYLIVSAGQKHQTRCSWLAPQRCFETWDRLNFLVREACILHQAMGNPFLSLLVKYSGNRIVVRCLLSIAGFQVLRTNSLSIFYCFHQGYRSNVFPLRSQACFGQEQAELLDFQWVYCSTWWCVSGVELMAFLQSRQLPYCSRRCLLPKISQLFDRDSWARHRQVESFEWWRWLQFVRALFLVP